MTEPEARRVVLALMAPESFRAVLDTTIARDNGHPIQEDFGFTFDEVRQAHKDRVAISERYRQLKTKNSFQASEIKAKTEFLSGLGKDAARKEE